MARILVIEDDIDSLELITYLLQAFGHTPLSANNGITGLEMVYSEIPDLILCDVNIPGYHGYKAARRLKDDPLLCKIPLIAVTAFAMVGDHDNSWQQDLTAISPSRLHRRALLAVWRVFCT